MHNAERLNTSKLVCMCTRDVMEDMGQTHYGYIKSNWQGSAKYNVYVPIASMCVTVTVCVYEYKQSNGGKMTHMHACLLCVCLCVLVEAACFPR